MSNFTVTIQENSTTQVILWFSCVLKLNILFSLINTLKVNFLKQVSGATRALEYTSDLPKFPDTYDMPKERALDVFDFLHYVFGFQVHTIFFSLPEPLHSRWKGVFLLDGNILQISTQFFWAHILTSKAPIMFVFLSSTEDGYQNTQSFLLCFSLEYKRWVPKCREFSCVFFLSSTKTWGYKNVEGFLLHFSLKYQNWVLKCREFSLAFFSRVQKLCIKI